MMMMIKILSSRCNMGLIVSILNSMDSGTRMALNTPTRLIIVGLPLGLALGLPLIAETTREMILFRNTLEEYMVHTMNLNKTRILIDEN